MFQQLEDLLAQSPEDAARAAGLPLALDDRAAVVLYGAGVTGRTIARKLRQAGVEPAAFADDTEAKHGQQLDGLAIMARREAAERYGARAVFIVTMLNPMLRFVEARRRVREVSDAPVYSFLHLASTYPDHFLPYYPFNRPQHILSHAVEIRRAFELWADEESRRQFVAHLSFRLHLDYDALPASRGHGYFPVDVVPRLPEDTVFVDCGAYDGDSIRGFLEHQRRRFGRIYAFEPDRLNCERLRAYVATLGDETAGKIHIFHAGVGDRRATLRFDSTGDMSASFTDAGAVDVEILPLEEIVDGHGATVYVKLDIEGAESDALKGAAALLARARPILAISVYHRPDDLWRLPLYVESLDLGYRFFLRTQGEDGMDVVCYASPSR